MTSTATKKFRAQRMTLDMPREGLPVWTNITVQVVFKDADYQTVQIIDRVLNITRQFEQFAQHTVTITDPITGQTVTLSGAGVGLAISEFVIGWMVQDIPHTAINAVGDVVQGS